MWLQVSGYHAWRTDCSSADHGGGKRRSGNGAIALLFEEFFIEPF
jgi:hypothetical protein